MTGPGDLRVTGLCQSYGTVAVLRDLDLVVSAGTFLALLGPSGSGKTTLLRTLAGFERPAAGVVALGDRVLDDASHHLAPEHRRVGYVSQDGSLFPHLRVAGNVAFGLSRGARKGPQVADLLAMVGLSGLERRYPHELSGGQQQRVAVARALATDPHLVLLDEPFAALDDTLRQAVRADVAAVLARHGATVILVTHDQDEALSTADAVAVLAHGRVVQVGPPHALYRAPTTVEAARLVGSANLLAGVAGGGVVQTALGVHHPAGGGAPDGPVTAVVRPEQVTLGPADGTGVAARVTQVRFHGHDGVVTVTLTTEPATTVLARVLAPVTWRVGDAVRIAVRGDVVVLAP